jgi:predicted RNase H-like nuclease
LAEFTRTNPTPVGIFTDQQVAERGQQVQSVTVFSQAAIADFVIAKDLFMYLKGFSTLAQALALSFSAFSLRSSSFFRVPGRFAMNQNTFLRSLCSSRF